MAIGRAYRAGIIMVAAAGNEGEETIAAAADLNDAANTGGGGYSLDQTPMYPVCHDGDDNIKSDGKSLLLSKKSC